MLSVIVPVLADEQALVETLAALVPAVADGAIRDVSLASPPNTGILRDLSDATGCRLVEAQGPRETIVRAAAEQSRCDWVLVLEPGLVPGGLWADEATDFVVRARRPESAGFTLHPARGTPARARAWAINLAAGILGRTHPDLGLIRPRRSAGTLPFTRLPSPIHDRRMGAPS
jgi:hypothetical protein